MMSFRQFDISDDAVAQARRLGMDGDARVELARMARYAAPLRHENGNRRFEGWWLRIENGVVTSVGRLGGAKPAFPVDGNAALRREEARLRVKRALALNLPRKK